MQQIEIDDQTACNLLQKFTELRKSIVSSHRGWYRVWVPIKPLTPQQVAHDQSIVNDRCAVKRKG